MAGRFTFGAGNTLTAAQINTNIMDGIPFKIVANVSASFTGSLAMSWPVSFTTGVVPIVTATIISGNNTSTSVTMNTPTATGVTFYAWTGSVAATTAKTVHYTAIQMTSTTGSGNS